MIKKLGILTYLEDKASPGLEGIKGKVSGLGSSLGGITKGALKAGAVGIAAVGTAAAAAGAALLKMASDAAPIQGIKGAFQALNKDADQALATLRKGSLGMVSDADLMRQYNEAVQLVGKSFADDLPEAMQYLNKISASTGQDMGYLIDSLTTGIGRLSPQILDNLKIQVDATAANETYALSIGKAASELTKEEQQAALMAQVLEKLKANTASLPDVTDNATTSMAQLKTTFQNVKDGVGLALVPALSSLLKPLAGLAQDAAPKVIAVAEKLGAWLGENIPKAVDALGVIWNKVIPAARDTGVKFYEGIKPGLEWLKAQFDKFTTAVLPGLKAAWDTVSKGWNEIKDLVNTHLKPAIDELAKSLGIGKGKTDEIGTSFGQFIGWIISTGVKGIIEGIKLAVEGLSFAFDQGKKFVDNIKRAFESLKDAIQWVKDRINELKDAFNGIKDSLPDWLVPGSPTPFEIGLRGIARAIKAMPGLSFSFKGENSTFDPGRFNPGGGAIIIHNHFGKDSVRSDKDVFDLANQIARSVRLRGGTAVIA